MNDRQKMVISILGRSIDKKEAVGLEIECFSRKRREEMRLLLKNENMSSIIVSDDGSIHPSYGMSYEFQTPAIPYDKLFSECQKMNKFLQYCDVNTTCGLHIHVNISPYLWKGNLLYGDNYSFLKRLFIGFKWIEPYIFEMIPESRHVPFCRQIGGTLDEFICRVNNLTTGNLEGITSGKGTWVNIHPLNWMFPNIEIRLHEGTVNPRRIYFWSKCMNKIIKAFYNENDDILFRMVHNIVPQDYLKTILTPFEMKYGINMKESRKWEKNENYMK